jgi:HEAT repeat protein
MMPATKSSLPKSAMSALVLLIGLALWLLIGSQEKPSSSGEGLKKRTTPTEILQKRIPKSAGLPPGERPGATPTATGFGSGSESFEARGFIKLSDRQRQILKELIQDFDNAEWEDRIELLNKMEALAYGEELLPFIERIIAKEKETDVKARAIELLAGNTSPKIIPLLENALNDKDEDIRLSAIFAANAVAGPQFDRFIGKIFSHTDKNTRLMGFEILENQPVTDRLRALDLAINSGHKELQFSAIDELQFETNHRSVEILIPHLDSADEDIRENARSTVSFLLNEDFESASEAQAWWQANKATFDSEPIQR